MIVKLIIVFNSAKGYLILLEYLGFAQKGIQRRIPEEFVKS